MSFFDFIITRNLWSKKARSIGLTFAVAFAVMTVVTLGVTSSGLEKSAAAIISVGKADFTVGAKGCSDTSGEHDRPHRKCPSASTRRGRQRHRCTRRD